mgnify:CR=1 FL=1
MLLRQQTNRVDHQLLCICKEDLYTNDTSRLRKNNFLPLIVIPCFSKDFIESH